MKRNIIYIVFMISSVNCLAQYKTINFIITIDNNVDLIFSDFKIKYSIEGKYYESSHVDYTPGALTIDTETFDKLKNQNCKNISLEFAVDEDCESNIIYQKIEINDFKVGWLNKLFFILKIYTIYGKFKKYYRPLEGKTYTYEYNSSGVGMKRAQIKFSKQQRKCNNTNE